MQRRDDGHLGISPLPAEPSPPPELFEVSYGATSSSTLICSHRRCSSTTSSPSRYATKRAPLPSDDDHHLHLFTIPDHPFLVPCPPAFHVFPRAAVGMSDIPITRGPRSGQQGLSRLIHSGHHSPLHRTRYSRPNATGYNRKASILRRLHRSLEKMYTCLGLIAFSCVFHVGLMLTGVKDECSNEAMAAVQDAPILPSNPRLFLSPVGRGRSRRHVDGERKLFSDTRCCHETREAQALYCISQ